MISASPSVLLSFSFLCSIITADQKRFHLVEENGFNIEAKSFMLALSWILVFHGTFKVDLLTYFDSFFFLKLPYRHVLNLISCHGISREALTRANV